MPTNILDYEDQALYRARITGQSFRAYRTGTDAFVLEILVLEQLTPQHKPDVEQLPRELVLYLTEKTFERTMEELHDLGIGCETFGELDPRVEGYRDLTGIEITVLCEHELDKNNMPRERWRVPKRQTVPRSRIEELDRDLRRSRQRANGKEPAPQADVTSSAEWGISDADVPF
jgi:hypothetical protein